jgi:hypothetical protein
MKQIAQGFGLCHARVAAQMNLNGTTSDPVNRMRQPQFDCQTKSIGLIDSHGLDDPRLERGTLGHGNTPLI